jgi:membrane fusion protein (multidrug efflux system)
MTDAPAAPRPRRRNGRLAAALLAVILLLLGTGHWVHRQLTLTQSNDARVAADMITVSSERAGRIVALNVTEGQVVAAGELLVQLDDATASVAVAENQAALEQLRAARATLQSRIGQQREAVAAQNAMAASRLRSAQASLAVQKTQMELARRNAERADALIPDQVISVQSWDQIKNQRLAAEESTHEAEAQLAVAQAGVAQAQADAKSIDVLEHELGEMDAAIAQAEAALAQQRLELSKLSLLSPVAGVIDETFANAGEYAVPGRRLLMMHDPRTIRVEANVKETAIGSVKLGAPVQIRVDAYPGRTFTGHVSALGQAATSQFALIPNPNPSGNFTKITPRLPIRVELDPPESGLRPGMMVEIAIEH